MAGGINDVDVIVIPVQGGILGEDGDAAFSLQSVGIHHPFDGRSPSAEAAGLLQQFVYQRGLAVIHMGDNGDITKFFNHDWVL
jgi:hypothetical protein